MSFISLFVALLFSIFLAGLQEAVAQEATPTATVRQLIDKLVQNDLSGACKLMTETDQSGPLTLKHYEQMQLSLGGLSKMWQDASFSIGEEQINAEAQPPSATVTIALSHPKQDVKVKLLKYASAWYVGDIEIYFK